MQDAQPEFISAISRWKLKDGTTVVDPGFERRDKGDLMPSTA